MAHRQIIVKKKIQTTLGKVELRNEHRFVKEVKGIKMAPYFKDVVCYVGQSACYESSSDLINRTIGIEVDDNTIHRLCNEYGEKSESWLEEERRSIEGKPEVGP